MPHDIDVIVDRVGGIGRHHHRTDSHDGQISNRPFRSVFGSDHHPVTGVDAQFHQCSSQRPHRSTDLSGGHDLPRTVFP